MSGRGNRDGIDDSDHADNATNQYWLGILDSNPKSLKLGSSDLKSDKDAGKRVTNLRRGVYEALKDDLTAKLSSNDKAQEILDDELNVMNFPSASDYRSDASNFKTTYNKIIDDLVKIRKKTK